MSRETAGGLLAVSLGCLLEYASLFVWILSSLQSCSVNVKCGNQVSLQVNKKTSLEACMEESAYQRLTQKLRSGELKPTQRAVKHYAHIGNEKIARLFQALEADGIVMRRRRGYALV